MLPFLPWLLAFFVLALFAPTARAACGNVEFPEMNNETIVNQFRGALVRIDVAKPGSGFLIDAKQGFILTAGHVVDGAAVNTSFSATTEDGIRLTLVLRKDLSRSKIDLALLQTEPSNALSSARPIDISMRVPRDGASAYAMGYSRGESYLSKQPAIIQATNKAGQLVVRTADYPGDSGGPLFSRHGVAIGIATGRIDNAVAYYTPMEDALDLLKMIPVPSNIADLDQRIRARKIEENELTVELTPWRTATSPTNVELVSWASMIGMDISSYIAAKAIFHCPIIPAFSQRFLEGATPLLRDLMTTEAKAEATRLLADNAYALRRSALAATLYRNALAEYAPLIADYTSKNSDGILYGFCQTGQLNKLSYGGWRDYTKSAVADWIRIAADRVSQPDLCVAVQPDMQYAALLEDYAKAAFGHSKFMTTRLTRSPLIDEALRAAAVSVTASGRNFAAWFGREGTHSDLADDPDFSRRLVLMGDLLFEKGAYQTSADTFAAHLRLIRAKWLLRSGRTP